MRTMKLCANFFVVLVCIALFTGCKKNSNSAQTQSSCKINTIVNGTNLTSISYNIDGTVSLVTSGIDTTSYLYSGNTITETTLSSGQLVQNSTVTVNSSGLATNVRTDFNVGGTDWQNEAYEYNGSEVEKQISTTYNSAGGDTTSFQWSAGNLASSISNDGFNVKYDYFTDKLNQSGDINSLSNLQEGYETLKNKNIVKTIMVGANDVINVTYTYDTDGKITSLTENGGGGLHSNFSLQYQCN